MDTLLSCLANVCHRIVQPIRHTPHVQDITCVPHTHRGHNIVIRAEISTMCTMAWIQIMHTTNCNLPPNMLLREHVERTLEAWWNVRTPPVCRKCRATRVYLSKTLVIAIHFYSRIRECDTVWVLLNPLKMGQSVSSYSNIPKQGPWKKNTRQKKRNILLILNLTALHVLTT